MSEPNEIEPYYRRQGKQLVDCLFDKGILSESLSRDGMDAIEELLAYYLQSASETAARTATLTKKYKVLPGGVKGEPGHERHEEEMRWIARAREAEGRVAELEETIRVGGDAAKPGCACPPEIFSEEVCPRCGGRKLDHPNQHFHLCLHSKESYPGAIITKCLECGGNRI